MPSPFQPSGRNELDTVMQLLQQLLQTTPGLQALTPQLMNMFARSPAAQSFFTTPINIPGMGQFNLGGSMLNPMDTGARVWEQMQKPHFERQMQQSTDAIVDYTNLQLNNFNQAAYGQKNGAADLSVSNWLYKSLLIDPQGFKQMQAGISEATKYMGSNALTALEQNSINIGAPVSEGVRYQSDLNKRLASFAGGVTAGYLADPGKYGGMKASDVGDVIAEMGARGGFRELTSAAGGDVSDSMLKRLNDKVQQASKTVESLKQVFGDQGSIARLLDVTDKVFGHNFLASMTGDTGRNLTRNFSNTSALSGFSQEQALAISQTASSMQGFMGVPTFGGMAAAQRVMMDEAVGRSSTHEFVNEGALRNFRTVAAASGVASRASYIMAAGLARAEEHGSGKQSLKDAISAAQARGPLDEFGLKEVINKQLGTSYGAQDLYAMGRYDKRAVRLLESGETIDLVRANQTANIRKQEVDALRMVARQSGHGLGWAKEQMKNFNALDYDTVKEGFGGDERATARFMDLKESIAKQHGFSSGFDLDSEMQTQGNKSARAALQRAVALKTGLQGSFEEIGRTGMLTRIGDVVQAYAKGDGPKDASTLWGMLDAGKTGILSIDTLQGMMDTAGKKNGAAVTFQKTLTAYAGRGGDAAIVAGGMAQALETGKFLGIDVSAQGNTEIRTKLQAMSKAMSAGDMDAAKKIGADIFKAAKSTEEGATTIDKTAIDTEVEKQKTLGKIDVLLGEKNEAGLDRGQATDLKTIRTKISSGEKLSTAEVKILSDLEARGRKKGLVGRLDEVANEAEGLRGDLEGQQGVQDIKDATKGDELAQRFVSKMEGVTGTTVERFNAVYKGLDKDKDKWAFDDKGNKMTESEVRSHMTKNMKDKHGLKEQSGVEEILTQILSLFRQVAGKGG